MLRALLFVGAGTLLVFGDALSGLPSVLGALLLVLVGVASAVGASERMNALAIAFGAIGVLASGTVASGAPALGGAVLLLFLYLERMLRARTPLAKLLHVALVLAIGAATGAIGAAFAPNDVPTRLVAAVVVATLAGMPLFLSVRDRIGESLARGKSKLATPLGPRMGKLLDLYELGGEIELEPEVERATSGAWTSLAVLVEQRIELQEALKGRSKQLATMTDLLDRNIERHADLLERAYEPPPSTSNAEEKSVGTRVVETGSKSPSAPESTPMPNAHSTTASVGEAPPDSDTASPIPN